jgi:hypothetical protein
MLVADILVHIMQFKKILPRRDHQESVRPRKTKTGKTIRPVLRQMIENRNDRSGEQGSRIVGTIGSKHIEVVQIAPIARDRR